MIGVCQRNKSEDNPNSNQPGESRLSSKNRENKIVNRDIVKALIASRHKRPRQFMSKNLTKSPLIAESNIKSANNTMSQSIDNFDQFQPRYEQQKYYPQQVEHGYDPSYNTIQDNNNYYYQGYNEGNETIPDMRNSSGFSMMHPGMDMRQGYSLNQSVNFQQRAPLHARTTTGFYNDPGMDPSRLFFNSPNRDSHFQMMEGGAEKDVGPNSTRPLLTERQYKTNQRWISKMNKDYNIPPASFGLKKGTTTVQKFRRKNILRTKSKLIKIS